MSDRRIDAFFYGLFMDSEVLKKFGSSDESVGKKRRLNARY